MTAFAPHHIALSVRDLEASKSFYAYFGFRLVAEWSKSDSSLTISHLRKDDGFLLELFNYADYGNVLPSFEVGNNLREIGVKHVGFTVPDLEATRAAILEADIGDVTAIARGRTLIDYFFVTDPDGMYVEIVKDVRDLDWKQPLILSDTRS